MLEFFNKLSHVFEYRKKYKDMPDAVIMNDLYQLASCRNMDGIVVSDHGAVDASKAVQSKPSEEVRATLLSVWYEVVKSYPRKVWFYETNKRMARIQG